MMRADRDPDAESALELADVFAQQARLRIDALFAALWKNTDTADVLLADRVLDGRHTWLEAGILDPSEGTGPWIAQWDAGPSETESVARRFLPSTREN
jgi:hypothetical protein